LPPREAAPHAAPTFLLPSPHSPYKDGAYKSSLSLGGPPTIAQCFSPDQTNNTFAIYIGTNGSGCSRKG
jgi:hypothetical protein